MSKRFLGFVTTVGLAVLAGCGVPHMSQDAGDAGDSHVTPDGDANSMCPSVAFIAPMPNATLGPSDAIGMSCATGFSYDVRVATNATAGTMLDLFVGGVRRAGGTADGASVTFHSVQFDTHGTQQLQIRVPGNTADCGAPISVTIECNTPRCTISQPTITALNLTNNVNTDPTNFAAAFTVQTDIEDGLPVTLEISPGLSQMANVAGGTATFPSVAMHPDGHFSVRARCVNRVGTVGLSATNDYTVDTHMPSLTVTSPPSGMMIPFTMADVDNTQPGKQFNVCAHSDGAGGTLMATVHGGAPLSPQGSATIPASPTLDACVEVTCPTGSAQFDVDVTVTSTGGNTRSQTIQHLSCASSAPSVRIVSPTASVQGTPSTYLNASSDANTTTAGFQFDVVACTDSATGTASLLIGGTSIRSGVALTTSNAACATAGFANAAVFTGVTIPESNPALVHPNDPFPTNPVLQVNVDNGVDVGTSPTVFVFVDSVPPHVALGMPSCGAVLPPDSTGGAMADVYFSATDVPVTLTLQHGSDAPVVITSPGSFTSPTLVVFSGVMLQAGITTVRGSSTDFAGNVGTSAANCSFTVGNPPALSFTAPTNGQVFGAAGDADGATPGFQGVTVTLSTDASNGSTVTLTVGTATALQGTVSGGTVTFANVTLGEGNPTNLRAAVVDAARGTGNASINVTVDTSTPTVAAAVSGTVSNRRQGLIHVSWMAPSDQAADGGTQAVTGYDVRWSTSAITAGNFSSATPVTYVGMPGVPGATDGVDVSGLQLGFNGSRTYFFAVQGIDAGGNRGTVASSTTGVALDLAADFVSDPSLTFFGIDISGGFDLNGDSISDVVVGSSSSAARVLFGARNGLFSIANSTLIQGLTETSFGFTVLSIGDMNGDGIGDVAIGAPESLSTTSTGHVYVFYGRSDTGARPFPRSTALTINDADLTIAGSNSGAFTNGCSLGSALARADFDGDSLSDLVIASQFASPVAGMYAGAVVIVRGKINPPATVVVPTGADVVINGAIPGDRFGRSVAFGGSIMNASASDAIVVGSNGGGSRFGAIYAFAGRSLTNPITLLSTDADFTRSGAQGNWFAYSISAIGDVNGDGRPDLSVGSNAGNGGMALLFGNVAGQFDEGPFVSSASGSDFFGLATARLPDRSQLRPSILRGSSTSADLVAGETLHAGSDPRLSTYVGRSSWTAVTASNPDAFLTLATSFTSMGGSGVGPILWAGDVTGDGVIDVVASQARDGRILVIH